jgi:hypothetical protein
MGGSHNSFVSGIMNIRVSEMYKNTQYAMGWNVGHSSTYLELLLMYF